MVKLKLPPPERQLTLASMGVGLILTVVGCFLGIKACLEEVCAYIGWPVGHAYIPVPGDSGVLESTGLWHLANPERYRKFRRAT